MKVKLTVNDIKRFELACESQDIAINERKSYGSATVCIVNIKHASQLYNAGLIQNTIELTAVKPEQVAEKEVAKAETDAKIKK
jgi:hypothetical protein